MSTPAPSRRSPSFNKATSAKSQATSVKSSPKTKRLSFVKRLSNFFTRKNKKKNYSLTPINEDEDTKKTSSLTKGSQQFFDALEESPEEAEERKRREEKASTTIKSFFKKTTVRRKANFLGKKCPDSGVCMALGIYTDKIKDFFGGFTDFLYCKDPIKRIGSPSSNGFVNQLEYVKGSYEDMSLTLRKDRTVRSAATATASATTASRQIQYTAYAILKSSAKAHADNLMYEYIVGQFLNKQNKFFPCFLETYGLYKYKSNEYWKNMYESRTTSISNVKEGLELQDIDYSVACSQSIHLAILIQYFKGVNTLKDALTSKIFSASHQLIYVLFQIYYTLAGLADTFTHYDLHWNNVLLYEPIKDKYIEYHYHHKGAVVSFKSNYMIKIIDYGRCFFYDNRDNNSAKIHEKVCKTTQCQSEISKCGQKYGFGWLDKQNKTKNVTADLRLLMILFLELDDDNNKNKYKIINTTQSYLTPLLKTVIHNMNENMVIENKKSGLPHAINNVTDAFLYIKDMLLRNYDIADENKKQFENKQKLGDLYIYDDGKPIEFIPYQPNNREIDALITKLEIQISDLKTRMFKANKIRDVDDMEKAYKEIILLLGKITDLFCDRIDNINDLASLETIREDINSDITKSSLYSKLSKSAKSTKTDYPYESALLDLHTNELNDKLAYVTKRITYLLRKTPYLNKNTRKTYKDTKYKDTNFSNRETDV